LANADSSRKEVGEWEWAEAQVSSCSPMLRLKMPPIDAKWRKEFFLSVTIYGTGLSDVKTKSPHENLFSCGRVHRFVFYHAKSDSSLPYRER
jgi:hypothetical protein